MSCAKIYGLFDYTPCLLIYGLLQLHTPYLSYVHIYIYYGLCTYIFLTCLTDLYMGCTAIHALLNYSPYLYMHYSPCLLLYGLYNYISLTYLTCLYLGCAALYALLIYGLYSYICLTEVITYLI